MSHCNTYFCFVYMRVLLVSELVHACYRGLKAVLDPLEVELQYHVNAGNRT